MTVTRASLISHVCDNLPSFYKTMLRGHARNVVAGVLKLFIEGIQDATLRGEDVELRNFIRITTKEKAPQLVFCRLGDKPGFRSTRPYVSIRIRAAAKWKEDLSKQVRKKFVIEKKRVEEKARALEEKVA